MKRKQLFSTNKRTIQNCIPVSITYNRFLYIYQILLAKIGAFYKYHLLKVFDKKPNLGELIGSLTFQDSSSIKGESKSCNTENHLYVVHKYSHTL